MGLARLHASYGMFFGLSCFISHEHSKYAESIYSCNLNLQLKFSIMEQDRGVIFLVIFLLLL